MFNKLFLLVVVAFFFNIFALPIPLCDSNYLSPKQYEKMKKETKEEYKGKEKKLRLNVLKKMREESKPKDNNLTVIIILNEFFPNITEAKITGMETFSFQTNNKRFQASVTKSKDLQIAVESADLALKCSLLKNSKEETQKIGNTTITTKFSHGTISGYSPDKTLTKKLPDGYLVIKIKEKK